MPASSRMPRGRVVVGGEHRDALAVGVACGAMSTTVRRRRGWSWHSCAAPAVAGRAVCARHRVRPARAATRSSRRWATSALVSSGHGSAARPGRMMVTRFVSVPKPEPGSATSLATSRSTPLRAALAVARSSEPVSAANPTRTRPGAGSGAARAVSDAAASARMSSVGSSSSVRPAARPSLVVGRARGRKSATAAAMTSASALRERGQHRVAHLRGRGRVDDQLGAVGQRHGRRADDQRAPARPGRAPPRAIATPILPVERLPMKRTGSIGSAVPPAVTTIRQPARSRACAGDRRVGGRVGRVGRAHRSAGEGRLRPRRRSMRDSASRPWPDLARRERARPPARRSRSRSSRSRSMFARVAGCAYISPSMAGATITGAVVARQVAVTTSSARPRGHGGQPARRGRARRGPHRPSPRPRCARCAGRAAAPADRASRAVG